MSQRILSTPPVDFMTASFELDSLMENLRTFNDFCPTDSAVLMFLRRVTQAGNKEVLLIRKKRGLGAGKINGPGGKREGTETFQEASHRETLEEVGLSVMDSRLMGRLFFRFTDGYHLYVEVFTSENFDGFMRETEEADPFWCPESEIPYEQMWADDALWLPHMLSGGYFTGCFTFDQERMLNADIRLSFEDPK